MRIFEPGYILTVLPQLVRYLPVTLGILAGTVLLGGALGILLAVLMIRGGRVGRAVATGYIYVVRCIPTIVLLFLVFYGVPQVMLQAFGRDINGLDNSFFVLLTLSILYSANMAEVARSAYLAIDHGQLEAALAVGLPEWRAVTRIMLPQAVAVALPNFTNSLVALMKEAALAYTIGVVDIMGKAQLIIANNYGGHNLETYLAVSILYWIMTILFEGLFGLLEKRLSRGKNRIRAEGKGEVAG